MAALDTFIEDTAGPMYRRIADILRQRLRAGVWRAGQQFPTIDDLIAEFGVARVTVRQALGLLESDGLITRGRGRGTFVTEQAQKFEWVELAGSWDTLIGEMQGHWTRLILSQAAATVPQLRSDEGTPTRDYQFLRRLHGAGEKPHALFDIYLDREVFDTAPARFEQELIIPNMKAIAGLELAKIHQTLTIGSADIDAAGLLGLPVGAPVGIMRRTICDDRGTARYIGDIVYRGDMVRLKFDIGGMEDSND